MALAVVPNYGLQTGGAGISVQGNNKVIQGSSPKLQSTANPQQAASLPLTGGQIVANLTQNSKTNTASVNSSQADWQNFLKQFAAANQKVYAPTPDFNALNSQARAAAENNVNPYYTLQLNNFLAKAAQERQQTEQQNRMDLQTLEDQLTATLEGNEISRNRTAEDTTANLDQIAATDEQNQMDSGQQFAADRITNATDIANAGLTGGLGAQQTEAIELAHAETERRAGVTTQQAKDAQELGKARTFEDLTRAGELATKNKEQGVKQKDFDLTSFIANQTLAEKQTRDTLEGERQIAINDRQGQEYTKALTGWIQSIKDPAKRQAAYQAYL